MGIAWSTRLRGVRVRTAGTAAAVVGLALVLGASALVVLLDHSLTRSLDAAASDKARQVAAQISAEGVDGLSQDLSVGAGTSVLVEVRGPSGQLVATSTTAADLAEPQLPAPAQAPDAPAVDVETSQVPGDEARSRVASTTVVSSGQRFVVSAAVPEDGVASTIGTVVTLLAVGVPILVVVTGAAAFVLVGRSLKPVEGIRREVAAISARRLDERIAVPASGDEVARLAATMNDMLARLDSAGRAQRRFVADASHELRSPLAVLRAGIEVAAADASGSTWEEVLPTLTEELARMRRLVDDLLLLAKSDEGAPLTTGGDVDLDDLVESELRRLRSASDLDVRGSTQPVRVRGDRAKLALAIRNVVDNAQRHTRSVLLVNLSAADGLASLEVEDDGPGIDPADRERVFERFVRLDSSRERASGGSGLGLAIVSQVIKEHAGTVVAGTSPLGGARFLIRLPMPTACEEPLSHPPSARSR